MLYLGRNVEGTIHVLAIGYSYHTHSNYTADCSFTYLLQLASCMHGCQFMQLYHIVNYQLVTVQLQLCSYLDTQPVISSALTRFKHHIISRASCGQINLFHCSQCTAYIDYMCTQALGNILIKHYSSHMDNISHHTQCYINIPPLSGTCRNCITVHLAALDHFSME